MKVFKNPNREMKLGTIDGLSFEKSRSHHVQSLRGGYNNLRSHGYAILNLCRELGVNQLSCSTDTGDTGEVLCPTDDMSYSLTKEFTDIHFGECTHQHKCRYGILVQTLVDPQYIHRIEQFVDSVDILFIYSSDYEYELRKNTFNLKFLFEFLRDPGENKHIADKIIEKVHVAFCGWYHISQITPRILGIPCIFLPQVINPNIPKRHPNPNEPRPYDGFFMGMNDRTVDFMKGSDNKSFISIQYRDYSVPHTEYRNVTQVQQAGICTDIKTLVNIGSLAKFHCITNSWKNLYPQLEQNSDMFVNQTFKIFEAYYCGMYPINPASDWEMAYKFMNVSKWTYYDLVGRFLKEMEDNYSMSNFLPEIKRVAGICKLDN